MNLLKGKVEKIQKSKDHYEIFLATESGSALVTINKETPYLKKGQRICFSGLLSKRGFIKTTYEFEEGTLFSLYPKFIVFERELKLAYLCEYAPILFELVSKLPYENDYEKKFIEAVRGLKFNVQFSNIADKFPKDIKGKFSFKPYEFSVDYGLFVRNALYLGKLPIVFVGNEIKGEMQAIMNGVDKYVIIDQVTATMHEVDFDYKKKFSLLEARNKFIIALKNFDFKEVSSRKCEESCPAFQICSSLRDIKEEEFNILYSGFLKQMQAERKSLVKLLSREAPHRRSELSIFAGQAKDFEIEGKIKDNEPYFKEGCQVVVIEKPPLDRKTFGKLEEITFDTIKAVIDWPIVNPEALVKIDSYKYIYPGVYRFLLSRGLLRDFFDGKKLDEITVSDSTIEQNDPYQNKAVNLILAEPGIAFIKGENGTGKKYVVLKALEELHKRGKNSLIITDSRIDEFKNFFNNLVKISNIEDDSIYLNENEFDYIFLFLTEDIGEFELKSYAGVSKNLIVLSSVTIKSLKNIDNSRTINLGYEHRFGKKITHFVSPILSNPLEAGEDILIKIVNKENIDVDFVPIVNPEKIVQFIEVKSLPKGNKNKWNEDEARLTVEIVKQFLKAGVERKSIEIVVPYERQQKLILKMLEDEKIEEIFVKEVLQSFEKDIVIVNLVDEIMLDSPLKDVKLLKFTLTRAKSKLLIIGNRKIVKGSPALAKLILKS